MAIFILFLCKNGGISPLFKYAMFRILTSDKKVQYKKVDNSIQNKGDNL